MSRPSQEASTTSHGENSERATQQAQPQSSVVAVGLSSRGGSATSATDPVAVATAQELEIGGALNKLLSQSQNCVAFAWETWQTTFWNHATTVAFVEHVQCFSMQEQPAPRHSVRFVAWTSLVIARHLPRRPH